MILFMAVVFGEGGMSWGLYWPILLSLSGWDGVYWLGLSLGVLLSVIGAVSVGLPSLFVVVVLAGAGYLSGSGGRMSGWLIVISLAANFLFDRMFGLPWSIWEAAGVLGVALFIFGREGKEESISVHYK